MSGCKQRGRGTIVDKVGQRANSIIFSCTDAYVASGPFWLLIISTFWRSPLGFQTPSPCPVLSVRLRSKGKKRKEKKEEGEGEEGRPPIRYSVLSSRASKTPL